MWMNVMIKRCFIMGLSIIVLLTSMPAPAIHANSPTDQTLTSITYANNTFVTVGANGTILTSSDGVAWTSRTSGTTSSLNRVTYGNGIFIAVGRGSAILTSPDGTNWTDRSRGIKTADLYGVSYGNGTFVAVGDGMVYTSVDGATWLYNEELYSLLPNDLTFGDGTFTGIGGNGLYLTSSDGLKWNKGNGVANYSYLKSVSYGNGTVVAVGAKGAIFNRKRFTQEISGISSSLNGVKFINNTFVAVGDGGTILTSSDAITWTSRPTSNPNAMLNDVSYGNGTIVAVGAAGTIIQTTLNTDAPTAVAATANTASNTAVSGILSVTDPGAVTIKKFSKASNPLNGTVTVNEDGTYTYVPASNYSGTDSFTFTVSNGITTSAPAMVTITVSPVTNALTANPVSGATVEKNAVITLGTATSGATIFYTTDGSTPNTNSASGNSITITGAPGATVRVKAYAVTTGMNDSAVSTFTYTISNVVEAPTANPASGAKVMNNTAVFLSTETSFATIFFTTDGTTPTKNSAAMDGLGVHLATITGKPGEEVIVNAIAAKTGMTDSAVSTFKYTVQSPSKDIPIVSGVSTGGLYNKDRVITFDRGTAILNDQPFQSGSKVSEEGRYSLFVRDTLSGLGTSVYFQIDKTAPVVTGITADSVYDKEVTITFNEGTASLNNSPFLNGDTVSNNGIYTLDVSDLPATIQAFVSKSKNLRILLYGEYPKEDITIQIGPSLLKMLQQH